MQRTYNNVTIPDTGASAPDATGFNDAIFGNRDTVRCDLTLRTPDLNDATLMIDGRVEITTDPTGLTGWTILTAETWQGGPQGRAQVPQQPIIRYGPTTAWPPFERLRITGIPSRTLTGVDVVVTIL
jgi:hypothetical protein